MAAQTRIIPQEEADKGFGLLKDIVEMVKNPKAIDEAYERRLKAVQLSQDEILKYEEARVLISKADELREELGKKTIELENEKKVHEKNVAFLQSELKKKEDFLNDWNSQLNATALAHEEVEKNNSLKKKELDEGYRSLSIDSKNLLEEYNKKNFSLSQTKESLQEEADRLSSWETRLKAKATRLAAVAASE